MKRQIAIIHGGDSFKTRKEYISFLKNFRIDIKRCLTGKKDWKNTLDGALDKKFEIVLPRMPSKNNAKYAEWKTWFKKFVPYFKSGIILIGHSLGGLFLAKYLSENNFPREICASFLIAAPYDRGDFAPPKTFKKLEIQGGKLFLYHSRDDAVVPFGDFKKYQKNIKTAVFRVFNNKNHFNQEKFPELVKDIRTVCRVK